MKKILVVLLAIALSCTPVIGADLDPNFASSYENKKGLVTFNHEAHATSYECAVCHDNEITGILVDKSFGHKTCKSCHKAVGQDFPNAPVRCNGCHVK
jgi:hypothetical protein